MEPIDYITSNCYESIELNDLRKGVQNTRHTIHNTQYTIHSAQYTWVVFQHFPVPQIQSVQIFRIRTLIRTVQVALLHEARIKQIDFEAELIDLQFLCYPGLLRRRRKWSVQGNP